MGLDQRVPDLGAGSFDGGRALCGAGVLCPGGEGQQDPGALASGWPGPPLALAGGRSLQGASDGPTADGAHLAYFSKLVLRNMPHPSACVPCQCCEPVTRDRRRTVTLK